ncbi:lytic murein transglycosylase [Streptomyces spinoverrucosus]|uniref:lytic transglycosylase domain-containing protein n=1 Tax=Streptomyces spinoverrucosus TaxID=284043 RepID=UPI0018C3C5CA|nr:lytic transglycosylase domain-containing protein [Streptomyces spinoverrucosus]MBG0851479.1 lytic murein transglycosylase [Streptomyces spinoverrucosus]
MAVLTASQAPGVTPSARAAAPAHPEPDPGHGPSVSGDTPYRTELPPLRARKATTSQVGGAVPVSVFAAYRRAEARLADMAPGCGLRWQLLAAIGQVESGQARGGRVAADGTTPAPVLGPRLDGNGFALIRDTDGGALDGDAVYDRAVGPMQFIPSTWAVWGTDGNGDGRADPHNVFDAALAAGRYLCAGGRDLTASGDLDAAILGYNRSTAYLRTVRAWFAYFLAGHRVVPDAGAAGGRSPEREASRPVRRGPSPTPGARPAGGGSGTPSPDPAPSPTAPRPSPTGRPSAQPSPRPPLPLPGTGIELPGDDDLLPSGDLMGSAPSTSAATGR